MKPNTIFLSKIWVFAFLSSILFKHFLSPNNWNTLAKLYLIWFILLLPAFFAFMKFGTAILINSEIDKKLNYKKELSKLALFISVNIWMLNFFVFTLMWNLSRRHFYTIPFLLAMIIGIYFFEKEKYTYDEQILDEEII